MFLVDKKRAKTMRNALGKNASDIIKEDKYLPFFRSRQKKYPKEFEESVKLAKTKRNPYRYLSKIWAFRNIEKTLLFIGKILKLSWEKISENISNSISLLNVNKKKRQKILNEYGSHGFLTRKN